MGGSGPDSHVHEAGDATASAFVQEASCPDELLPASTVGDAAALLAPTSPPTPRPRDVAWGRFYVFTALCTYVLGVAVVTQQNSQYAVLTAPSSLAVRCTETALLPSSRGQVHVKPRC
jgi:hypothetical protein